MCQDDPCPDEDLIERYYAGEDRAFEELHGRYFRPLFAFFRGLISSQEEAEDRVQEVFLRVAATRLTQGSRFDRHQGSFRGWLYRIASNQRVDSFRAAQRGPAVAEPEIIDQIEEPPPVDPPSPQWRDHREELPRQVYHCLQSLPAGDRDVLWLIVQENVLKEISTILDIAYGTAGRRLNTARRSMRECLSKHGYQMVSRSTPLPAGALVVMTFPDETLVFLGDGSAGDSRGEAGP